VRVTLSGPGILTRYGDGVAREDRDVQCQVSIPAKVETRLNYAVSVRENVGTGLVLTPPLGKAVNPELIRFK
jgi:hypothetical protein